MGMLATVMNALAMQDAIEKAGGFARTMSAIKINEVCEDFIRRRAIRHLEKGRIALFAAGTGNPFFTTDSAAALRAIEIDADLLLKATKVDGVYSADPRKDANAKRYEHLSYEEVIQRNLQVMDTSAIALCRDHNIPLRIYDMSREGDLMRIMRGEADRHAGRRGAEARAALHHRRPVSAGPPSADPAAILAGHSQGRNGGLRHAERQRHQEGRADAHAEERRCAQA